MRHAPIGSPLRELIERTHASAHTHSSLHKLHSLRVKSAPQASAISFAWQLLSLSLLLSSPFNQNMLQLKRVQFPCKMPAERAVDTVHTHSIHIVVIYDLIGFPIASPPSPFQVVVCSTVLFVYLLPNIISYFNSRPLHTLLPWATQGRSIWHPTHLARN